MTLSQDEILDKYREAGKVASAVVAKARKFITPDKTLLEVAEFVESSILEKAGVAFPCNLSLNEAAAHYTPTKDDPTLVGKNVLKVDLGAHIDGFVADTAFTLDFTGRHADMVRAAEDALKAAIPLCRPGTNIRDIGQAIQETIESRGFHPVSNLSGHLLGRYDLHAGLSIPNIASGDAVLQKDMVIAIEPFATSGCGQVTDSPTCLIFMFVGRRPVRMPEARQILEFAETTGGLPFAKRWLDVPQVRLDMALRQLVAARALYAYPILIEKTRGVVTQAEHTVIVGDKPEVTTL